MGELRSSGATAPAIGLIASFETSVHREVGEAGGDTRLVPAARCLFVEQAMEGVENARPDLVRGRTRYLSSWESGG